MKTVGVYEAKTHLTHLLDDVANGETFIITKHGVPVAQLTPAPAARRRKVSETIAAIEAFRLTKTLGDLTVRDLIEEGRRY